MSAEPLLFRGTCCACGQVKYDLRNVLMLNFRALSPGDGCWGCVVCGLPNEGAVAVVCDECMEKGRPVVDAVVGTISAGMRVPIAALTERFDHDLAKHEEFEASQASLARLAIVPLSFAETTELQAAVLPMLGEGYQVDDLPPVYRIAAKVLFGAGMTPTGVCKGCGCTDVHACPEGCSWANKRQTLCTACLEKL